MEKIIFSPILYALYPISIHKFGVLISAPIFFIFWTSVSIFIWRIYDLLHKDVFGIDALKEGWAAKKEARRKWFAKVTSFIMRVASLFCWSFPRTEAILDKYLAVRLVFRSVGLVVLVIWGIFVCLCMVIRKVLSLFLPVVKIVFLVIQFIPAIGIIILRKEGKKGKVSNEVMMMVFMSALATIYWSFIAQPIIACSRPIIAWFESLV